MKPLPTTPPTLKKTHPLRTSARSTPRAAATRRREMTPEEFASAAAKRNPKGREYLAVFDHWEKKHPGYGEWAWPRLKAAMERNNGRTRKFFADYVIVAALAIKTNAVIATEIVAHLARFVDARPWSTISPATLST